MIDTCVTVLQHSAAAKFSHQLDRKALLLPLPPSLHHETPSFLKSDEWKGCRIAG